MSSWTKKNRIDVHGRSMAYVERGMGDPIIFLHGNPTSSYLWRDVMPPVEGKGRLIAPDLIGMGDSDKLPDAGPDRYTFAEHRRYLDGLLEALGVTENVTLVIHDWGSALGFDWAFRHPSAIKGIAYMEGLVRPLSWEEFPEPVRPVFQLFRSSGGEKAVLEDNMFVEQVLPGAILRKLTDEEMAEYRRPFSEPGEGRRPTLTWPRQIPIDDEPEEVVAIVQAYSDWLQTADVPKLYVNAIPGALITGDIRKFARSLPNQTEVTVDGVHFIQEDSGPAIGEAISSWLDTL
ncbi:MAG: haloalkane dehalogenase [Pseudomonadota bacterium]